MEKKLQKIFPTYYNLLIVLGLWQAHYQILSMFFLKEFVQLNVNKETMINKLKQNQITELNRIVELNISIVTVFLNAQVLKMI